LIISNSAPSVNITAAGPVPKGSNFATTGSFTDPDSTAWTATVDYGDGSGAQPLALAGKTFNLSHIYAHEGAYTVKVAVTDDVGSTGIATATEYVFAYAPGGSSFVIGDKSANIGTEVTFWGAQWSKLNALSGASSPSSFKGFSSNPKTPAIGSAWSTDPGNSASPPAGPLPTYMLVIVSSSISKSGSQISGNTLHLVVVEVNSGYDGNPGHAGTGTVVAQYK
jgi:hypothetical protein